MMLGQITHLFCRDVIEWNFDGQTSDENFTYKTKLLERFPENTRAELLKLVMIPKSMRENIEEYLTVCIYHN